MSSPVYAGQTHIEHPALVSGISLTGIPQYMRHGVYHYIVHGAPVGSFLTAVFENNLMRAYQRADENNQRLMHEYAKLLYHGPAAAMGSENNVRLWQASGGLDGMLVEDDEMHDEGRSGEASSRGADDGDSG